MSVLSLVTKCQTSVHRVHWKIQRFATVAKNDALVNSQAFNFEAGEVERTSSGPLKWKLFLEKTGARTIKVLIKLESQSELDASGKDVYAQFRLLINGSNDTSYYHMGEGVDLNKHPNLFKLTGRTNGPIVWNDFLNLDDETSCLDKSGALWLTCIIELMHMSEGIRSTGNSTVSLDEFNAESASEVRKVLVDAIQNSKAPFTDVTMISWDKKEVKAKWGVLAARSPVFAAMYESEMKEKTDGMIELKTMSGRTMEVFHHFISTGILLPAWKEDEVILELVDAAAMYQLTDLLEFLDKILETVCNKATVIKLLSLAERLSLKKASENLLEWIKNNGMKSSEDFLKLMEPVATLNVSDDE